MIDEAKGHVCGYLPGPVKWDSCPSGGKGVDAATVQVPEAITTVDEIRQPAAPTDGKTLRYSFLESLGVLGAMLVVLLGCVLGFLKMRDIL